MGDTKIYFRAKPWELEKIQELRREGLTMRQIMEATCSCSNCASSFIPVKNKDGVSVKVPIGLIKATRH